MKTLHVIASLDEARGGSARAVLAVCDGLQRAGAPATIATTVGTQDSLDYIAREYGSVAVVTLQRQFPQARFRSSALRAWLDRHTAEFDLVEIHGLHNFAPLYGARAATRSGVPYVCRPHGELDPYDLRKHSVQKRLFGRAVLRRVLSRTSGLLFTTERERERAVMWGATPEAHVVPLPVAPPGIGDRERFRGKFQIPGEATVVLFLGRFDEKKGLDLLIPACRSVAQQHPNLWLALAGSGLEPMMIRLRAAVSEAGIGERTAWCGFLSGTERLDAFAGSDIFALPSHNENFGIAAVEAAYAGLRLLISRDVFVHRELEVLPGVAVCEATGPDFERALEASVTATPSSTKARAHALDQVFGQRAATTRLLAVYEEIAARRDSA